MRLVIRGHPLERMRDRGVTREDIENAIRNHHSSWSTQQGGIQYIGPACSGDDLKVWVLPPGYCDDNATIIVKSVAWKGGEDSS